MHSHRNVLGLGAVAVLAFTVAACSGSAASPAPTAAASVAASAAAGAAQVTVSAATGTVGAYLTGPNGMTLYTLKTDTAGVTTCTGTCAANWPPFTVNTGDTFQAGSGVTGTLASFARPDSGTQVTYDGQPLYYYGGDKKAGDTNGQGVGSKWYVASPTGMAPASGAPSASASGYNY